MTKEERYHKKPSAVKVSAVKVVGGVIVIICIIIGVIVGIAVASFCASILLP